MNPRIPTPQRVLVLSLAGAGDTLLATPLLREIHLAWPHAHVDVLTMQGVAPQQVLEGNPDVHRVENFDFLAAGRLRSVWFCLRQRCRRYDLSFTVMPQNRLEYNLITWLIGARWRVGFEFVCDCGARPRWWLTHIVPERRELHVVENNLRLWTEGLGQTLRDPDPRPRLYLEPCHHAAAEEWLAGQAAQARRRIGFHPGSGTTKNLALKRWPLDQWTELARRVGREGSTLIVLFGSRDERPLREAIVRSAGLPEGRVVLAPDGSVRHTAALIARMDAFVCGDTLLTHVAAAMNVPTVAIVGPTDPRATGPYRVPRRIVRLGLPCSPCYFFSKHGILCTHPRPMACLQDLGASLVEEAVQDLLRDVESKRENI